MDLQRPINLDDYLWEEYIRNELSKLGSGSVVQLLYTSKEAKKQLDELDYYHHYWSADGQLYGYTTKNANEKNEDWIHIVDFYERFDLIKGFNVVYNSPKEPEIYVCFPYSMVKCVLKNNIPIYHDYMDQGFAKLDKPWFAYKNFVKDSDGDAAIWYGEGLWISKKDFEKFNLQ